MTNNQEQKIPDQVIRFYGHTDYALECIALKQITFVHLDKLNDPFDPVIDNLTDFNDNYESLLSYIQQHHPTQLASFKAKLPEQNWKTCLDSWATRANKMRASMFVFSTCGVIEGNHPRDNLYMWGHYGNGHRGIAIEFNTTALAKSLIKQNDIDSEPPWWKIEYPNKLPKIKCEDILEFVLAVKPDSSNLEIDGLKLSRVIQQRFSSKSEIWVNENEWRLVWDNDETKLRIHRYDLPNNAITAIYLGCRVTEQQQNDFIHETQRNFPSASIFCANMRKGEYALDFEKII